MGNMQGEELNVAQLINLKKTIHLYVLGCPVYFFFLEGKFKPAPPSAEAASEQTLMGWTAEL